VGDGEAVGEACHGPLRGLVPSTLPGRRRWSAADAGAVLDSLAASGLSVGEFAARGNLNVQRLYRWRAQLGASRGPGPAFIEVRPPAQASMEVVLRSGRVLRVPMPRGGSGCAGWCGSSTRRSRGAEPAAQRAPVCGDPAGRRSQGSRQRDGDHARCLWTGSSDAATCSSSSRSAASVSAWSTWDRNGFAMWTKRLEVARFRPSFSSDGRLASTAWEAAELALIVEGIDLAGAQRRRRWQTQATLEKKSSRTPSTFLSTRDARSKYWVRMSEPATVTSPYEPRRRGRGAVDGEDGQVAAVRGVGRRHTRLHHEDARHQQRSGQAPG
jgi:hypothetical protein